MTATQVERQPVPAGTSRPARARPIGPAGRRPTGRPDPRGSPAFASGSPRPASMPTSASGPSTAAISPGSPWATARIEGCGIVGLVPRRGRRGRPVRGQSLPDPGRARGARRADRAGLRRPRGALGGAGRFGRGSAGRRRGRSSSTTRRGPGSPLRPPRWSSSRRGLARGRPRGQGAGRDRARSRPRVPSRIGALATLLPGDPGRRRRSANSRCGSNG